MLVLNDVFMVSSPEVDDVTIVDADTPHHTNSLLA